jgi:hypothetical protein
VGYREFLCGEATVTDTNFFGQVDSQAAR